MRIEPVTAEVWGDLEAFFTSVGRLNYCWCMPWRLTNQEERHEDSSAYRHGLLHDRVQAGTPVGLLAYDDDQPVAWCSVGPRASHRRLGGDESLEGEVWSLTCFFIARQCRHQGLTSHLIEAAKIYARDSGAAWLEAYPVLPDSPSYSAMGRVATFERAGFGFVRMAGSRRHVMAYDLKVG